MPASFDYAVLRLVPRVEREEFLNVGVLVFCREKRMLAARTHLDEARLQRLWPDLDLDVVRQHLHAVERIAAGDADAGPIARLSQPERFHWLVAPRSTILQTSPVRTGIYREGEDLAARLLEQLVLPKA
ncbi:MAG TPA: DUF3037 domain-containing protein [Acidobacteriaceae bacterium]|nr:DUF3037 domain-containing protein [Acidobacteriaceae bacterium]